MHGEWEQKVKPVLYKWDRYYQAWLSTAIDWMNRSNWFFVLTAPFIYALWLPDIILFRHQHIYFPFYGIQRVNRSEYIVFDRQKLSYLNKLEELKYAKRS